MHNLCDFIFFYHFSKNLKPIRLKFCMSFFNDKTPAESVPILATLPAVQSFNITKAGLSNTLHFTSPRLLKPNDHLLFIALVCLIDCWAINHLLARKLSRGLHIIHISNPVVIQVVSCNCYSFMAATWVCCWNVRPD